MIHEGRLTYNSQLVTVTVNSATPIDLWEIATGTARPIVIHSIVFGQLTFVGDANEVMVGVTLTLATTSGSGGTGTGANSPPTGAAGFPASTATIEYGNTTLATGLSNKARRVWNVRQEFIWPMPGEDPLWCPVSSRFVVRLLTPTLPAASMVVSGTLQYEEMG